MRFLSAALLIPCAAIAAEGMWPLDNLPVSRLKAQYSFTPGRDWVDHVMRASARIAGGCSASFVSKDGLVMTNHHCAAACLAQLSSAKKNFIADGFLARGRGEEVRCPEIEINRLERISDVTDKVKGAVAGLDGEAFKLAKNAVEAKLSSACVGADRETARCDVVDLYHGGLYHLYRYRRFQDVRLAFAPELAIAFFGGDPDNFNFPRYDLDIALLRVYENGGPARLKDFFPFSKAGAEAGEMVFVSGHPGSTQRQLTMSELETFRDVRLIGGLLRLAEERGILEQYGKLGPEAARIAENDLFGIENSYKALVGELKALLDPALMKYKQKEENELRAFVASRPALRARVGGAWDAIEKAQQVYREIEAQYSAIEQARAFTGRHFGYARALARRRGAGEAGRGPPARVQRFAPPGGRAAPVFHRADLSRVRDDEAHLVADENARAARRGRSFRAPRARQEVARTARGAMDRRHPARRPGGAQGPVGRRQGGDRGIGRSVHQARIGRGPGGARHPQAL